MNSCKGQCCRNPFGVCHHNYRCTHHNNQDEEDNLRQIREGARLELQLERRRR